MNDYRKARPETGPILSPVSNFPSVPRHSPADFKPQGSENLAAKSVSKIFSDSANSNHSTKIGEQQSKLKKATTDLSGSKHNLLAKIELAIQFIDQGARDMAKEYLNALKSGLNAAFDAALFVFAENEHILSEQAEREATLKKQMVAMNFVARLFTTL